MQNFDQNYLELAQSVMETGFDDGNRTATPTRALMGGRLSADLSEGKLPILTTKKVNHYAVEVETDWFASGSTNVKDLQKKGVHIWDNWMRPEPEVGLDLENRPIVRLNPVDEKFPLDLREYKRPDKFKDTGLYRFAPKDYLERLDEYRRLIREKAQLTIREIQQSDSYVPKNKVIFENIYDLWVEYFESTIAEIHDLDPTMNPDLKTAVGILSKRTNRPVLSIEWHDFSRFSREIISAPNFWPFIEEVSVSSLLSNSYILTGEWDGVRVVNLSTAKFVHREELKVYQEDDIVEVFFNNDRPDMVCYRRDVGNDGLIPDQSTIDEIWETGTCKKLIRYAFSYGELGPVYGKQWRDWEVQKLIPLSEEPVWHEKGYETIYKNAQDGICVVEKHIDQLGDAIEKLKNSPSGRRINVVSWNPAEVDEMELPPCHLYFQFVTQPISPAEGIAFLEQQGITNYAKDNIPTRKINMTFVMRSSDVGIGLPFNMLNYALLLMKTAAVTNMVPGVVLYNGINTHVYHNHFEGLEKQSERLDDAHELPNYKILNWGEAEKIEDVKFEIDEYKHHPFIKLPVAV